MIENNIVLHIIRYSVSNLYTWIIYFFALYLYFCIVTKTYVYLTFPLSAFLKRNLNFEKITLKI